MRSSVYLLPANPASPTLSVPNLRARAKRAGYQIARDRYGATWSLIDAQLRVPLLGYDHVELGKIARAVETARNVNVLQRDPVAAQMRRHPFWGTVMTIEQAIQDLRALGKSDAEQLGDQIRNQLIDVLQRDPALPARTFLVWTIALANARQHFVEHINLIINDHVDRNDVYNELRDHGLLDAEYEP
jgi:hypothetical protein